MYRLFLIDKNIIVYDKTEKEFKESYGNRYEQIFVVKDGHNIELIIDKLQKQYKANDIIYDCHIKKKFGWKYFSEEKKAEIRHKLSLARAGKPLSDLQKQRISEAKKGKPSNHTGHKHNTQTKIMMSLSAMGNKGSSGLRWCHDPITGKEKMKEELPEGYVWGRNPDVEIHKNLKQF